MNEETQKHISRRNFVGIGVGGAAALVGATLLRNAAHAQDVTPEATEHSGHDMSAMQTGDMESGVYDSHVSEMLVGTVDHNRNGFDPMQPPSSRTPPPIEQQGARDGRIREFPGSAPPVILRSTQASLRCAFLS